ncbi:MAG: response regulator, partial [Myxococcales bacterium]|nr:response regulator [Myxococcales bacterium]
MSKKLLLAESSVTIQKSVAISLAKTDFELASVKTGPEAFQKAQEFQPDVIALDVVGVTSQGYETCLRIKSDPKLSSVPVLLLSGTSSPIDEARLAQSGANAWLQKPFDSQVFLEKLAALMGLPAPAPLPGIPKRPVPSAAVQQQQPPSQPQPSPQPAAKAPPVSPVVPMVGQPPPQQGAVRPPVPGMMASQPSHHPSMMAPVPGQQSPPGKRSPQPTMPPSSMSRPPMPGRPQAAPQGAVRSPMPPAPTISRPPLPAVMMRGGRPSPATPTAAGRPAMLPADPAIQEQMLRALLQSVSRDVIERVVWEVVPQLAEVMIREQIERLIQSRGADTD